MSGFELPNGGGAALTIGDVIGQVFGFQPTVTNIALQSQSFNAAPWALAGGAVLTSLNNVDPRGGLAAALVNDPGGALAELNQPITVPNNNAIYLASIYVSLGTSTLIKFGVRLAGGAALDNSISLIPQSGVIAAASPVVSEQAFVINGQTWYRLTVQIVNNTTGNVTLTPYLQPATANAAAVGNVLAFGLQVEQVAQLATSTPSAYIPTVNNSITIQGGYFPSFLISQNVQVVGANANYQAALADNGSAFVFTNSAGVSQLTLPALASIPDGYNLTVLTVGSRQATIKANAAELIFTPSQALVGVNSYALNVNGQCTVTLVKANGQWNASAQTETHGETGTFAAGAVNFTLPLGVGLIKVDGAGGGGGGGGAQATGCGGGGGAGECNNGTSSFQIPGTVINMVVGGGGAGGVGANDGTNGTASTIANIGIALAGGNGGKLALAGTNGNGGALGGPGAANGGPGSIATGFGGNGGGSIFAPVQQTVTANAQSNGAGGIVYGGGGCGSGIAGGNGGAGATGFFRIRW